jgi:hypothetical protein
VWVVATIAAMTTAAVIAAWSFFPRSVRPIAIIGCTGSALHFWPFTMELFLGQADAFVMLAMVVALVWPSRSVLSGATVGVAAALKTWPGVAAAWFLFPRFDRRAAAAFSAVVVLVAATATAKGWLWDWASESIERSSQAHVSHSVLGAGRLNFSSNVHAQPIIESWAIRVVFTLGVGVTIAMAGWRALATGSALGKATALWAALLLLPVSHLAYRVFVLPVVWLWAGQATTTRQRNDVVGAMIMVAWWLIIGRSWPDNGGPFVSSLRYSVVFATDTAALFTTTILLVVSTAVEAEVQPGLVAT